ncbi:MAG: ATP-binding protein [Deltaproteobacteria bacterium]|nr:ATP-binding protein [Deltaproteobacteria bacterium]
MIPIVYSSAGVRRIITLAYLIVWAWNEHVVAAELARSKPQRRMVVLVDEMEAHLHPRWQRAVLPAVISIEDMLASELEAQYILATHSPLVMASSETIFNSETDSLVHLDLSSAGEVSLREVEFVKFGDVSSWLTSPVFELRHARSKEAEAAIEEAKALQLHDNPSADDVRTVSERLVRSLAQNDKFWPRWIYFAEKFGVQF